MSADIWLTCGHCGSQIGTDYEAVPTRSPARAGTSEFNLTYNLSPMLWAAGMPPWSEFIGMKASEAGPIWEGVHDELRAQPDVYRTLNPENGWGDYEGAVEVIGALADACEARPDAVIGGWL